MRRLLFYSKSSSLTGPLIIMRREMDRLVRVKVISFIPYSSLVLTLENTLFLLIFTVFEGGSPGTPVMILSMYCSAS